MSTLKNQAHLKSVSVDTSSDNLKLYIDCVVPTDIITTTPYHADSEHKIPDGFSQEFSIPLYSRQWGTTSEFKVVLDAALTSEENTLTVCKRAGGLITATITTVCIYNKSNNKSYTIHCNKIYEETNECVVCCSAEPTLVLQCGHKGICGSCKNIMTEKYQDPLGLKCPICRKYSRHYIELSK